MNFWSFEYSFDTDLKNQMLYSKIYGVWKLETAHSYVEELKEEAQPLIKKPWSKLVDLTNWKTVYPEVIQVIGTLNQWCRNNNMEWTVYIINQQVGFGQLQKMFDSGKYRDISRTFRTLKEGQDFLMEKGYKIRADDSGIFK